MNKTERMQKRILEALPVGRSVTTLTVRAHTGDISLSEVNDGLDALEAAGEVKLDRRGRDRRRWRVTRVKAKTEKAAPAPKPTPPKKHGWFPKPEEGVLVVLRTITPKRAAEILLVSEAEFNNRSLRQPVVDQIARALASGDWNVDGNTLKLDPEGVCYDGQHRLWAAVEADRDFQSYVLFNGKREHAVALDQGIKRTFADWLTMNGYASAHSVSALVSLVVQYENGVVLQRGAATACRLAVPEMAAKFKGEPERYCDGATMGRKLRRAGFVQSHIALLHYMTAGHELVADFVGDILNTELIDPKHPATRIRERLDRTVRAQQNLMGAAEKLALVIKAWNAYATAKEMTSQTLRYRRWGKAAEKFPVIVVPE